MSFLSGIGGKVLAGLVALLGVLGAVLKIRSDAKQAGRNEVNRAAMEEREANRETADRIDNEPTDIDAARERLRVQARDQRGL